MIYFNVKNRMQNENIKKRLIHLIKIVIVIVISLRLSFLPHEIFKDRDDYLYLIENSKFFFLSLFHGDSLVLFNEPLFIVSNYILGFILDSESILTLYVFINCSVVLFFVLFNRRSLPYSLLALILLLIIPYFYGATLGAVRQGLGFNLVLISIMRKDALTSKIFISSLFIASLFHVVFFVFFALSVAYKLLNKFTRKYKVILFFIFLIVLSVGVLWGFITPYLTTSQRYESFEQSTSGITFLGWLFVFYLFCYNYYFVVVNNKNINETIYQLSLFMFFCFLVFYWLAPGPYRILYSCTPLLVCSIIGHFNKYSALCFLSVLIYSIVLLSYGAGAGSMNISFSQFLLIVLHGI